MFRSPTKLPVPVSFLALLALAIGADPVHADGARLFSIPPGPALDGLREWGHQAGLNVLYDFQTVRPYRARGLAGAYQPLEALASMLDNTPLAFYVIDARSVSVRLGGRYCAPWLGAAAPLPPCAQISLQH